MRRLELFLDAKAANTPPRGISKASRVIFSVLTLLFLSIGQVWATDEVVYTLTPASGSNNSYTGNCDVEIDDITWNLEGNSQQNPWRIGGGKNTGLSNVNRAVYSKTAMDNAITKVELTVGAASGITVNSLKLIVASNADFSSVIEEVTETFAANSKITFTPESPATEWAANAFYKFVFNVSVSGTNNKYLEFTKADFYAEAAAPAYTITAQSNDESKGTVSLTGSVITGSPKAGFRYASPAYSVSPANSATVSQNGNAFTVTPSANTTVTINFEEIPQYTVTWNNNGDENTTTQVYEGEKPVFPATPAACDATSTTFIGWATAAWTGKIANLDDKTVYTSASAMPAVTADKTYYAVFAKSNGSGAFDGEHGGTFKIYAQVGDDKVYAGSYSSSKYGGTDDADDATDFEIAAVDDAFTIKDGAEYLTYNSSTNFGKSDDPYYWNIEAASTAGSWHITSVNTSGRGFIYRASTYNVFGAYSSGNVNGTEYYDVEISGATSYGDYMTTCAAPTCANLDAPTLNGDVVKTQTSATIKWNAVADASSYLVNVTKHEGGASAFSGNVGNELTKELTGLDANTQYDFSIMAVGDGDVKCADGNELLESNFTTPDYPTVTVTYSENGNTDNQVSKKTHTPFNLPTSAAACGKTFVGWTTKADFEDGDEGLPSYYASGAEFTITNDADITIYAVYADVTYGPATWDEIADVPTAGTYAICTESYFLKASINSGNRFDNGTATPVIEAGQLTTAPDADCQWEISKNASEKFLIKNGSNYAGGTDAKNKGTLITDATDTHAQWEITYDAGFTVKNVGRAADSSDPSNAYLRQNGTNGWATYAAGTGTAPRFFKKNVSISGASNYSITCVDAPTATPASNPIEVSAAGVNDATLGVTYENVNLAGVSVAICNDDQGVAFTGDWLTASVAGDDKHIVYTAQANTSYNDARTAYIQLTAPETSGAASPAVVYIEVTQAKKPAVFANLDDLVAAELNDPTNVTVSFSNVPIKSIYYYPNNTSEDNRKGVVFDIQKAGQDIKIYYNAKVSEEWVAGGKLSGTLTNCPWKIYGGGWQLAPTGEWGWNNLTYTAPPAIDHIEIRGNATNKTYIDGQAFDPAGLSVIAIYNTNDEEDVTTYATWTYDPEKLSEGDMEVEVTAEYSSKSDTKLINGLTVNPIPNKTIAQFIAAGGTRCYLEGTVSNYTNTTKGYFDITDASGTLHIYGCTSPSSFTEGDKIKVIAEEYEYYQSTTHEAKNVVFVSKISPVAITISDKNLYVNDTWTIQATTNPAAAVANISYSIKTGSDACIDETELASGVVKAIAEGDATIIATIPDGDGYLENSVEFEVHVSPAIVRTGMYVKVTNNADLTDGEYLIVYENENGNLAFDGSLSSLNESSNNFAVTIDDDTIIATAEIDVKSFTIEVSEGTNRTIKSASGKFIGRTGDSNGMNESTTEAYTNTISFDGNGNANIVGSGGAYLRYNSSSDVFRYYKSSTYTGQKAIQLYRKMDYTRAVSGNYGTICLPKAGVLTNGALYEIAEMDYQDNKPYKIYFDEVEGGVMVAGKPYIFKPNDGETVLRVVYTDAADAAEGNYNGLYGKYDKTKLNANDGNYILKNNQYYYVNSNNVYCEANRAYIKLSEVPAYDPGKPAYGRRRIALNINNEQVATGMDELNASEAPVKVMIDGKFYILRGEKMYDATGRLVK